MKYVLKNQEMQDIDRKTIQEIGIPGLVLMERASKAVADCVMEYAERSNKILVIAGIGNNGGDALAAARILLEYNYRVDYCVIGDLEKASNDLKHQFSVLNHLGYKASKATDFSSYDFIVEGIFRSRTFQKCGRYL